MSFTELFGVITVAFEFIKPFGSFDRKNDLYYLIT